MLAAMKRFTLLDNVERHADGYQKRSKIANKGVPPEVVQFSSSLSFVRSVYLLVLLIFTRLVFRNSSSETRIVGRKKTKTYFFKK